MAFKGRVRSADTDQRLAQFESIFKAHMAVLEKEPSAYGPLSIRSLLILREQCLHEVGLPDIF